MKKRFSTSLTLLALALAGCTALTPPVDVTRFHTLGDGAALAPGTRYAIAAVEGGEAGYGDAVDQELQRIGLVARETDAA
ncbi:MAG: hypothetical protein RLZZ58_610, partial [Pseudomonadota bacterium]